MRLLFWLVLVCVFVAWLSRNKKVRDGQDASDARQSAGTEQMLQCRYCGLHIPASEAIMHASGAAFCSEEHKHLIFPS